MKKTFIAGAVAVLSLAGSSAFAQAYVGINLGESHANRGCDAGAASGLIDSCDKTDFAWKINGGYQLPGTPWAGELTYFNLGKFKGTGPTASGTAKDSYWGLGAAYRPDFGSGWGGVARIGEAYGQSKLRYDLAGAIGSQTHDDWHPYYGLGLTYSLTKQVKLEADWDNTRLTTRVPGFSAATSTVNSFTLGASYAF